MPVANWPASLSLRFRRRRMNAFAAEFAITPETRVLDIGGTPDCWELLPVTPRVVLLNTPRAAPELKSAAEWVAGDGRQLPFRDGAFDIVFSNSVIEHVGGPADQKRFASEVARVGRAFWVQTPNRWFPVEQHLFMPLLHWLPKRWQRPVLPCCSLWRALVRVRPDQSRFYFEHYMRDVRLLAPAQLRALFPGARIIRERFAGLTKSLIAVRR